MTDFSLRSIAGLLAFAGSAGLAHADGHRANDMPRLPAYEQECAACHVAYPPRMLPAASWQRLMDNLPRHFGSDASLDPATARQIAGYLAAHAGAFHRVREEPPQDRITRSAWFRREHDEVPTSAWRSPAVKSPANCTACHAQANQGDFDEDRVRIPR